MADDDFFDTFQYPKAKAIGPISLIGRRLNQLCQFFFSSRYKNYREIARATHEFYSHPQEISFYKAYSKFGLHPNEQQAFNRVLIDQGTPSSILVVGCGAGREAFFLADAFPQTLVLGVDLVKPMIIEANSSNAYQNLKFSHQGIESLKTRYDLIWVTSILESHIQGQDNRVSFFRQLNKLGSDKSCIIMTPQIRKLHWQSLYFWSSQLLRLRWAGKDFWETGDVLLAHLGAHRKVDQLVFSHFYPSHDHFKNELRQAGFEWSIPLNQDSWVIKKGTIQPPTYS